MFQFIKGAKAYIYRIRKYIWASFAIFSLSVAGGGFFAENFPVRTAEYIREFEALVESMGANTPWEIFLAIFQNNAEVMLMTVGLGVVAGIFPLIFLLTNGFLVGVIGYLFFSQGLGLVFLAGILPHGIIELPCMFFSAATGLKIGKTAIGKLIGLKGSLIYEMSEGIKFAVTIILPLLVIAAFIESYITPVFIAFAQFAIGS